MAAEEDAPTIRTSLYQWWTGDNTGAKPAGQPTGSEIKSESSTSSLKLSVSGRPVDEIAPQIRVRKLSDAKLPSPNLKESVEMRPVSPSSGGMRPISPSPVGEKERAKSPAVDERPVTPSEGLRAETTGNVDQMKRAITPRPSFKRTKQKTIMFLEHFRSLNPRLLVSDYHEVAQQVDGLIEENGDSLQGPLPAPTLPGEGERFKRNSSIMLPAFDPNRKKLPEENPFWYLSSSLRTYHSGKFPQLNVLILIIGSRGDVQPFIVLAEGLIKAGHRVRIGTHEQFRGFVKGANPAIEFVDIGGDPKKMMEFIVKHPSMITLNFSEIREQQNIMKEIFDGCWEASQAKREDGSPYHCDVLICNPPTLVHVQLAERLGVPLQIWFTMPWSPTETYKHPFAWAGSGLYSNKNSYALIDLLSYSGNASAISEWRKTKLELSPLVNRGAGLQHSAKVPHIYCFSELLVPRPPDWGDEIDIVGFLFPSSKDQESYVPPDDLIEFLSAGDPPVYIGFGSIVVADPAKFTSVIIGAIRLSGVRCILSQGWMGLGGIELPPNVYLIGSCPHDWLFPRCSAVVHHGGAGTTSTGLQCGKPTVIIPFFGDQPFWGEIVCAMKVGPPPIMNYDLTPELLAAAIKECFEGDIVNNARSMGHKLRGEDSKSKAVEIFHKYLPVDSEGRMVWRTYEFQKFDRIAWVERTSGESWGDRGGFVRREPGSVILGANWKFEETWLPLYDETADADGWRYSDTESADNSVFYPSPKANPQTLIYRMRIWERRAAKVH